MSNFEGFFLCELHSFQIFVNSNLMCVQLWGNRIPQNSNHHQNCKNVNFCG